MRSPLTGFSIVCPVKAIVVSKGLLGSATRLRESECHVVGLTDDSTSAQEVIRASSLRRTQSSGRTTEVIIR